MEKNKKQNSKVGRKGIDLDLAFEHLSTGITIKEVALKMGCNYPNLTSKLKKFKKENVKSIIPLKNIREEIKEEKIDKEDTLREMVYNLALILSKGLFEKARENIDNLTKEELKGALELIKMQITPDKSIEKLILMKDVNVVL